MKQYIMAGISLLILLLCSSCTNMKELDSRARIYVDNVLPKIIRQWEPLELTKHGHTNLMKSTTFSKLEQQFFLFKSNHGCPGGLYDIINKSYSALIRHKPNIRLTRA